MLDALSAIGDVFGAIGDFLSSIFVMISYLTNFIYTCINQCADLLRVIPSYTAGLISTAIVFIVIIACKRAVID